MRIKTHFDLEVFKIAYSTAMDIFEITNEFPREELYSLTDQIRRSSRSVTANIAEAFSKRKYPKSFVYKLSDSLSEAAETQVWISFAFDCQYVNNEIQKSLKEEYDKIMGMLITMINNPEKWTI